MEEKVEMLLIILFILLILGFIGLFVYAVMDCYGTYDCIDIEGNELICNYVVREKSGAWGTTEDGRSVQLISYKKRL